MERKELGPLLLFNPLVSTDMVQKVQMLVDVWIRSFVHSQPLYINSKHIYAMGVWHFCKLIEWAKTVSITSLDGRNVWENNF